MKFNIKASGLGFALASLAAAGSAQNVTPPQGEEIIFAGPFECPAHTATVRIRDYAQSLASGGMGAEWGALVNFDRIVHAGNRPLHAQPPQAPTQFNVHAWSFTAPIAEQTGMLLLPPSGNHVTVISACPADFDVLPMCRANGGNARLRWSTRPDEVGACLLEPGRTYYLQAAHFSLSSYVATGEILNTCGCDNPPCMRCPISVSSTEAY